MAHTDDTVRHAVPQAGGIVVRHDGDSVSVLLVRAKKDPTLWIFPKGHIEDGETAEQAAVREVHEEAGVIGHAVAPIGAPLEFQSGDEWVRVQYFLIRPRSESPHTDGREKRWFDVDEATINLRFDTARRKLAEALTVNDR